MGGRLNVQINAINDFHQAYIIFDTWFDNARASHTQGGIHVLAILFDQCTEK